MTKIRRILYITLLIGAITACKPIEGLDDGQGMKVINDTSANSDQGSIDADLKESEPPKVKVVEEVLEEATKPIEGDTTIRYMRVDTEFLNVREKGELGTKKLTQVYMNQVYEVLDQQPDSQGVLWYQILTPDNKLGWVSSDYCIGGRTSEELLLDEEVIN